MATARILLVRHPETIANAEGRHVARGDSPYSSRGTRQASLLPELVRAWEPDVVVSSPQRRALVPARAAARDRTLRVDADLAEYDVGRVEGLTQDEGVARGLIGAYDLSDPDCRPFAGGESVGGFATRCRGAWERLLAEDSQRVAVLSHRGVIRFLLVHALELPLEALWRLTIEPAQAAALTIFDGHATLESLGALPVACDDATMHSNP